MPQRIGRAAQRSRRPPGRNPRGRALLRRGFVARLACSAQATRLHLAPARIAKSLRRRDSIWLDPALVVIPPIETNAGASHPDVAFDGQVLAEIHLDGGVGGARLHALLDPDPNIVIEILADRE